MARAIGWRRSVAFSHSPTSFAPPDAPRTYDQFLSQLESLGVGDEQVQVKLIREFRQRRMALAESNPPASWKYILEEVRKDPEKWGAMQTVYT